MLKNIFIKASNYHKNIGRNLFISGLLPVVISKNFGAYRSNPLLSKDYQKEKTEYNKIMKETQKKIIQEFWEEQTKIENQFLEKFMKDQKEKKRLDEAKLRNAIIKNAYICYKNIQKEIQTQQEFIAKRKLWAEEDTQNYIEKQSLLNLLDRQAEEDWLTPQNVEYKLSSQMNKILPPTILSHLDYYHRLNKYSLLIEQGFLEEAEELKTNQKIIKYKNKLMLPIFEELKTIIRHLTYTEEHSVSSLYNETILRIDNLLSTEENQSNIIPLKENLKFLFKKLITLIRIENEKPINKFEIIENQLKSLTMILVLWTNYVNIIYANDTTIERMIDKDKQDTGIKDIKREIQTKTLDTLIEENDPNVLKEYYFSKITDKKAKGSGLFINDINGLYDNPYTREKFEEKFEQHSKRPKIYSKEEEYTTESDDELPIELTTKEDPSFDKPQERIEIKKKDEKFQNNKKSTIETQKTKKGKKMLKSEKRKLLESEVSEVFEEEEETIEDKKIEKEEKSEQPEKGNSEETKIIKENSDKNSSDIKYSDPFQPQLSSKGNVAEKKQEKKKLLEEYMLMKLKVDAENSKYSKLDVHEEFKKYKSNLVKELGLKNEEEIFADIDKELKEIDLSTIVNLNDYENELKREQGRLTLENEFKNTSTEDLFSSSLFDTVVKYSKDIFDFHKPKLSTNLDIYDENLIKFLEYSIEESKIVYKSENSSIIMEYIKEELNTIKDEDISTSQRIKKKHLIKLADLCGRLKITDSQNLRKVFDMYKHAAPNI